MAVRLYEPGFEHAKKLVKDGRGVHGDRDARSEHQPSAEDENRFIEEHGFVGYARWQLGLDDEQAEETKARWKFPYGNFEKVHGAPCSPPSCARAKTTTTTSSSPRRTCTACSRWSRTSRDRALLR